MKTYIDLTDRMPLQFDVSRMLGEISQLKGAQWLDHYDTGLSTDYGAIPLVSVEGRLDGPDAQRPLPLSQYHRYQRTSMAGQLPYFCEVLDAFKAPKGRTRIMKLAPGAIIAEHRDIGDEVACYAFDHVRLHIPIVTNERVFFFVGGERLHMQPGRLYYVNFTKKHHVRNDGDHHRIHLVMDVRVNDWMRTLFPALSFAEKAENALYRMTLPPYWSLLASKQRLTQSFWRHYEGSRLQSLYHRLRPG